MHCTNKIVFRSTKQLAASDEVMWYDDKWRKLKVILNKDENGRGKKETPFGEAKNLLHYFIDFLFFSLFLFCNIATSTQLLLVIWPMVFMFRVSKITANFCDFLPCIYTIHIRWTRLDFSIFNRVSRTCITSSWEYFEWVSMSTGGREWKNSARRIFRERTFTRYRYSRVKVLHENRQMSRERWTSSNGISEQGHYRPSGYVCFISSRRDLFRFFFWMKVGESELATPNQKIVRSVWDGADTQFVRYF